MSKFYMVARGWSVGVKDSWEKAQTATAGCPNSLHYSFRTKDEAWRKLRELPLDRADRKIAEHELKRWQKGQSDLEERRTAGQPRLTSREYQE